MPQNASQIKITSNVSINSQKYKAYKDHYEASVYFF